MSLSPTINHGITMLSVSHAVYNDFGYAVRHCFSFGHVIFYSIWAAFRHVIAIAWLICYLSALQLQVLCQVCLPVEKRRYAL